ncbi:MAG: hypothetical protein WBQ60_07435 [Asticcacaulis sp.]
MSRHDHTAQARLTPQERREMLRAFADRMLMKITAMDDPEDMTGVERGVRVAAVIERVYSRCDRAEHHAPDPHKLEAERASHKTAAIKSRVELASILQWGDRRRRGLGPWWDAAQTADPIPQPPASQVAVTPEQPDKTPNKSQVEYVDYTDCILKARADLGLKDLPKPIHSPPAKKPPPPS